ncbi:DUF4843 domain-containing protein [Pedobacter riviphilus]|uniref:DUF4843 domain-containing protein n=1 Tax=Pedobacter riviphilus TaxID=2766984 RepID=A0ABX6TI12_9SPHI|nr:DUF4843 domain-containing protein [Pedobacter riviphilus]QNR85154.1 DUF4843 domain-containing protein [Pedobacter riviphilus]
MKKYYLYKKINVCILFSIFLLGSCKENDNLLDYDTSTSYIYFAQPNADKRSEEKWIDSISYSFALDVQGLKEKTIAIPLRVSGVATAQNRKVNYAVNYDKSKANFEILTFSDPIIRAGRFTDTLYMKIRNTSELNTRIMSVVLDLKDNDDFKVGNQSNRSIKISFTNQLLEPKWWKTWVKVFGPYKPEVYRLWIQLYQLGADPSPDLYGVYPAPYYYWDNMPTFASASSFPVTYMYIDVLRKYLREHEVYPNGDTTQPRIYLP